MINLLDLDPPALASLFAELGEKPFRAKQVSRWVHQHLVDEVEAMTDLSRVLREHPDGAKVAGLDHVGAPRAGGGDGLDGDHRDLPRLLEQLIRPDLRAGAFQDRWGESRSRRFGCWLLEKAAGAFVEP